MKQKCVISHEVPKGQGRFKVFQAGKQYDVPEGNPYFRPDEEQPAPVHKKSVSTRKKREEVNELCQ